MTPDALTIPAAFPSSKKRNASFIVLMGLALLIATFLRISLIVLYPLIVIFLGIFYKFKAGSSVYILFALTGIGLLLSFFGGSFLRYKALSLFYLLPLLYYLFSSPRPDEKNPPDHLGIFIKCLAIIAFINNLVGLAQIIFQPQSDDNFMGIYSGYSVSLNGLSLLNAVISYYYFVSYLKNKKSIYLITSLFFMACSVLGFYGAGLIVCVGALILSFFHFQLGAIFKTAIIGILSVALLYTAIRIVKPQTLEYNIANIKKIRQMDVINGPRKLTAFYNYYISYPGNVKDFLWGSGPGTFNSRSAFMIGSPSYFKALQPIKDKEQPYYFKNYAYPLWNEGNTSQALYLDGFRNQPFSSFLAFLGEYGLIFSLAFWSLLYLYYKRVSKIYDGCKQAERAGICFLFFKFLLVFLSLLLLIDNYFEYPEIMLLVVSGIKFSHSGLLNIRQNHLPV